MHVDLAGRVLNTKLPISRPLLPLFEAIVNSFHAIEELEQADGRIDVYVVRDDRQGTLTDRNLEPIVQFLVKDDGVGFTPQHYQSFETSDSTLKASKGGKGIGRFLWLKAFDAVRVTSAYGHGGAREKRSFSFSLEDGIANAEVGPTNEPTGTQVVLSSFKEPYRDKCPRRANLIAVRIIEHCMSYFLAPGCPAVFLHDAANAESLDLNQLFDEMFRRDALEQAIEVGGRRFRVVHLKVSHADGDHHKVHLCANEREVLELNLANTIPELRRRLHEEDGSSFVLSSFVHGEYLDDRVNPERTEFHFARDEEDLFPGEITERQLRKAVEKSVRTYLKTYLDALIDEKLKVIERFVREQAPQYRPLLKYRDRLQEVPPGLSPEKLDLELHRLKGELERQIKERGTQLLRAADIRDLADYKAKYHEFVEDMNELGKSNLAQYVVHRRLVLDLLRRSLEIGQDGRYPLEENVHEIVFPLKTDSDEIPYEQMNLWILDERLAYHEFLSSDQALKKMAKVMSSELVRPDLAIFNRPFSFAEGKPPFGSVVIVEFKRPQRDDYSDDENPFSQVFGYVRKVRAGKARDRKGRPISIGNDIPFYCYIVCDLTPSLVEQASDASLIRTPDGQGFFGYNASVGTYTEVMSFEKLVGDAEKRNRILFEKLHLPT